jgi:glycosyltransferase involved in cell wall biosynthesis
LAGSRGSAPGLALISLITPTWHGNPDTIRRCITSVLRQTYPHFEQIVASDGIDEPGTQALVAGFNDPRVRYMSTGVHHGGWGAAVRQEIMTNVAKGRYLVFLDDDNIIFPSYLEKMSDALRAAPEGTAFAICEQLHFGPLQPFHGEPPVVLPGVPQLYHIDTLQIMIETAAMRAVGWVTNSYFADGETFAELGRRYRYVNVRECLCAHL